MNGWIIAGPVLTVSLAAWMIAARFIFNQMRAKDHLYSDEDVAMYGLLSLLLGLLWPLLLVGMGPWMFVTGSARASKRKIERDRQTARLEYEIYGTRRGIG